MTSNLSSLQNMDVADLLRLVQAASFDDVFVAAIILCSTAGWLFRGILWDRPNPYQHLLYERPQKGISTQIDSHHHTRNVAEKLQETNKDVVIFWGSQSGTAEAFANRLAKECQSRFGLGVLVADLSEYDADTIGQLPASKLAVFIISTYGEGDPPDNSYGLWDWVNSSQNPPLQALQYVAFGLGNSNYKQYNRVVDCVSTFLNRCGAKELVPTGRGDDGNGSTEEDFMTWKTSLFRLFTEKFGYEERHAKYEPTLSIVAEESLPVADLHLGQPMASSDSRQMSNRCSDIVPTPIKEAERIFDSSSRSCLHIDLDISSHLELRYKTGDHLGVTPVNPDVEVDRLLGLLGMYERRHTPISISCTSADEKLKIPSPTTIDALFRYYLEICGPVSREIIAGLVEFAPNPVAKHLLEKLGKDKEAYAKYLQTNPINIGRLLENAAEGETLWKSLPLSFLIESLPPLRPRYYSISSSSVVQPRRPTITVAVSKSNQQDEQASKFVPGLTTNYLAAIQDSLTSVSSPTTSLALQEPPEFAAGDKLNIHIRKSPFKLPLSPSKPIIMISAGTGIAPFRGFLQERARMKGIGRPVGRTLLFFGCRNENDFLYREELETLREQLGEGVCSIVTAFSRPMTSTATTTKAGEKMYVQHRVKENAKELDSLLREENANLYICGSAKMAREVSKVLENELVEKFGWTGEQFRSVRHQKGRWQEDVWG